MAAADWERLVEGLTALLPQLEERMFLLISRADETTVFVQFEQLNTELLMVTGGDDLIPAAQAMSTGGVARLAASGWSPPQPGVAGYLWHQQLAWPGRSSAYRQFAADAVGTLRDLRGVPSPRDLEYRAWREGEPPPVGITYYEEDLEPEVPHLRFPELGLDDAWAERS